LKQCIFFLSQQRTACRLAGVHPQIGIQHSPGALAGGSLHFLGADPICLGIQAGERLHQFLILSVPEQLTMYAPPVDFQFCRASYIEVLAMDIFNELIEPPYAGFNPGHIVVREGCKGDLGARDKICAIGCLQPGKAKRLFYQPTETRRSFSQSFW
jgi:hypothetical protein